MCSIDTLMQAIKNVFIGRSHVPASYHPLVTQRRGEAQAELLQLVVVGQDEEGPLQAAHLLHLAHHALVDAVHDLLWRSASRERDRKRKRERMCERERETERERECV